MKTKAKPVEESGLQAPSSLTSEGREVRCISYAMNLVEQRLLNGTASSQETVFFLKLGLKERQLELERLENETQLLRARTEQISSAKESKELYAEAIKAMLRYSANGNNDE